MNRLTNRLVAATAGLAACGLLITGCGSGQISQTADQQAAVNGNSVNVKSIALRNVHLQATQTGDFLQPGRILPLLFIAANSSPDTNDKLVGITSDVGTVALTGDGSIPAGGALVAGPVDKGSDTWRTDLTASTLTGGANRWNFQAVNTSVLVRSQHTPFVIKTHRHPGTFLAFGWAVQVFGYKAGGQF